MHRYTSASIIDLYLLHLAAPLGNLGNRRAQAQHYAGWAVSGGVEDRLREHQAGIGAKLTAAAVDRGIAFAVARVWERVPLSWEKRLKATKILPRYCPICCAARGWRVRDLPIAQQLELPLEDPFAIPAPPMRFDATEFLILRSWRTPVPASAIDDTGCDIPW